MKSGLLLSKRLLQLAVAIGGLVPVGAGMAGILLGAGMIEEHFVFSISMDSHFRYLSGLLLGIGLGFWGTIPGIEHKTGSFRLLTMIVVIGGLGRLWALTTEGPPGPAMLFGLMMELAVTPLLAFWQYRLARFNR